jgi:hypothetical protein
MVVTTSLMGKKKRNTKMPRIHVWTPDEAQKELARRLQYCREVRKKLEYQWQDAENTLYSTRGNSFSPDLSISFETEAELGITGIDQSNTNVGVNYTFKNFRLLHSQLSANPPSVVVRPTSADSSDKRKADAADRLIRFAIRQYKLQELFDQATANVLQYGTGFIKTIWDQEKGDIIDVNPETGEVLMDGDISFSIPSPWDIYLDPDATTWDDVKFVFERIAMPWEEALFRFPDKKEVLEKYRVQEQASRNEQSQRPVIEQKKYDVVEVLQYWEKGLPHNGMIGKFCFITKDGDLLTPIKPNPFRFSPPVDRGVDMPGMAPQKKELPGKARLPYHIMTDADLPGYVWGRAVVQYEVPLQELYNRMLNVIIDNMQAHGVARLIMPETAEIADGSITNSPWDVIKYTGNIPPSYMEPMPMPPVVSEMIQLVKQGIDDMAGVNESMFGQQSREQSGFSMQYATNQGNMIRRRLFNKYVLLTENTYKAFLDLVRKHWEESRTIYVLGKEKAFEALDLKGADIDGGFDIVVEYGASLSLDPTTRREEIITLMPMFEKAGVEPRVLLQLLKLNELEGAYDTVSLADDRQREVFEEMVATGEYIPPKEMQDHKNMLSFAYRYVMTSEFKYLGPEPQALIERHIKEREQLAAQGAQPPGGPAGPGGAPPPPQGVPLPGPQGPMDVTQMPALANK